MEDHSWTLFFLAKIDNKRYVHSVKPQYRTYICTKIVVVIMGSKTIVEEEKIEEAIKNFPKDAFTVLDFIDVFREMYPEDWKRLVERFGLFGSKRRYTVTTYLSNRLDAYSHKPHSILIPLTRYKEAKFKDYRRTTKEEKKIFGSPWIAVFKKKLENKNVHAVH